MRWCSMDEAQVRAIFLLAGIHIWTLQHVVNDYWPANERYDDVRNQSPWWLVGTSKGLVLIGWRKRVIEINWSRTPVRAIVTEDDVTKDDTMVHAYSYAKAVEYLNCWRGVS